MTSLFTGIEPRPFETSTGPCELPILYRDGSVLVLHYRVDPSRARRVLGALPLEPYVLLGKTLVIVAAFEYRDSTVGRYNEIGIGVHAKRAGSAPSALGVLRDMRRGDDQALWVASLPVTTKEACAAGKELWGYPKYVTGIDTDFGARGARIGLEGELEIETGSTRGPRLPGLPFVTFSSHRDRLVRTIVDVGHKGAFGGGGTARLRITGDGPTAKAAGELGLDGARPAFVFRTDRLQAVLPAGRDVGPAGTGTGTGTGARL